MVTPQYEASAMIQMAQAKSPGMLAGGGLTMIESPLQLGARLRRPSSYTPESIKACGFADKPNPAESLARVVQTSQLGNLNDVLLVVVRSPDRETAVHCVNAIYAMVRSRQLEQLEPDQQSWQRVLAGLQQRLQYNNKYLNREGKSKYINTGDFVYKINETMLLLQKIDQVHLALSQSIYPRLIDPVFASNAPVYPKLEVFVVAGAILGFLTGLVLVLVSRLRSDLASFLCLGTKVTSIK